MAIIRNGYKESSAYNVIYSDMRGVDLTEGSLSGSRNRLAYIENMYRDYDGDSGALIESIPGFRKIISANERINGIFSFSDEKGEDHLVIHAGSKIYRHPLSRLDDKDATVAVCSARDVRSRAFRFGYALYLLDGNGIIKVSLEKSARVSDEGSIPPYVPTTFVNGERYEQLNLLSRRFKESYSAGSERSLTFGTPSLTYRITDEQGRKCAVSGISDGTAEVSIPAVTRLGDTEYSVTEIDDEAFKDNLNITQIAVPNGVIRIGANAFSGCLSLTTVFAKDTVEVIDAGAFSGCTSLYTVFLSSALKEIGASAFSMCESLKNVYYAKGSAALAGVIGSDALANVSVTYYQRYRLFRAFIPVFTPAKAISEVLVDGKAYSVSEVKVGGRITGVSMLFLSESEIVGREVSVTGVISEDPLSHSGSSGYLASSSAASVTGVEAINGATVAECFDGRIFISGNPRIPGVCFYSAARASGEVDPLYFGDFNYWRDGDGIFNTVALLATSDSLAVFNSSSISGGGIFYHTPSSTDINLLPKIYPLSYSHLGMGSASDAICFFDDPVFVSKMGITALAKQDLALGRRVETRSASVNPALLSEDLSRVRLAVWCGYLVVAVGKNIYLADSRSTYTKDGRSLEYDWFYLTDIGTYTSDEHVFRYSSVARDGLSVHSDPDGEVDPSLTVISATDEGGNGYFYTEEGGIRYEVYMTEQMRGGNFHALTEICTVGNRLFFGTDCGDVCLFNNDKRGIAPDHIRAEEDFDEEEYRRVNSRRIHPSFYSFASHAPRYALKTHYDNGGIPHLLKDTEKRSLTVKCKAFSGGSITFEVGTDTAGYSEVSTFPSSSFSFSDLDFSSVSLSSDDSFTVLLSERRKAWVEKQIALYSDGFRSPIGIYNIAYRFRIRGKLKASQ